MTTYYSIQTWRNRAFEYETFNLYESFDEVCDTIEGYMKSYIDFNESDLEKIKPNREEKRKNIASWNRVAYLVMPNGEEKHIVRRVVVPKKLTYEEQVNRLKSVKLDSGVLLMTPKKYVYQYFVEKEIRGTVVGLKGSEKYSSLDEMLDVLQPEVVMLHLNMWARNWVPYSRQTIREYMERNNRMIYNRVDDGSDEGTITYAIHKYET